MIKDTAQGCKWKAVEPAELAQAGPALPLLLDVREPGEFAGGRIAGSLLIPLRAVESAAAELDRTAPVVCVCQSGKRAAAAAEKLVAMGFTKVSCLKGGLNAWRQANLPVERDVRAPWSLERQVRVVAGLMILGGLAASLVSPWAIGLVWFVGAGLTFAGLTDFCGMGLLLARAPWNQRRNIGGASCCAATGQGTCCGGK